MKWIIEGGAKIIDLRQNYFPRGVSRDPNNPKSNPNPTKNLFYTLLNPPWYLYTHPFKPKISFNINWLYRKEVSIRGVYTLLIPIDRSRRLRLAPSRQFSGEKHCPVAAYNGKLNGTPFLLTRHLPTPSSPEAPFKADGETIERIKRDSYGYSRWHWSR